MRLAAALAVTLAGCLPASAGEAGTWTGWARDKATGVREGVREGLGAYGYGKPAAEPATGPANAEPPPAGPVAPGHADMAYEAGRKAARGADIAYGYAHSGAAEAIPYAWRAWESSKSYGGAAWDYSARGAARAAAWGDAAMAADWSLPSNLVPRVPGLRRIGGLETTLMGLSARDLAASALTSGALVYAAGYGCATLASPVGPAGAAVAYFGCSAAGHYVADKGLRAAYEGLGLVPDERAFKVGGLAGSLVGGWASAQGIADASTRAALRGYGANAARTFQRALPGMLRQAETALPKLAVPGGGLALAPGKALAREGAGPARPIAPPAPASVPADAPSPPEDPVSKPL